MKHRVHRIHLDRSPPPAPQTFIFNLNIISIKDVCHLWNWGCKPRKAWWKGKVLARLPRVVMVTAEGKWRLFTNACIFDKNSSATDLLFSPCLLPPWIPQRQDWDNCATWVYLTKSFYQVVVVPVSSFKVNKPHHFIEQWKNKRVFNVMIEMRVNEYPSYYVGEWRMGNGMVARWKGSLQSVPAHCKRTPCPHNGGSASQLPG